MSEHRLSRREFLKFAGVGMAGAALAACAPAAPAAPAAEGAAAPEAKPAAGGVTLQYYVGFGAGGNPEQISAVKELFAKFVSASGGAVAAVEPLVVPWAEAPRKFQTMVAGGTPPDVITMGMSQWDFAAKGAFVDINPLAEKDGINLKDEWDQSAIAAYTVIPKNNLLYGLPFGLNDMCLVYNKTLFEKLGVAAPPKDWKDESWTWDAFIETAQKLSTGEGMERTWGVLGIGANWNLPWCYGGAWVDEALEKIIIDQEPSMKGFQLNYDLIHKYKVMPTQAESQALANGFLSGQVGMTATGSWDAGTWMQIEEFEWDLVPVPWAPGTDITKRASPYYPDALVISSKNAVEQSWALVKFMILDDDNYKTFLRIMTMIPARKALRSWFVDEFWKQEKPDINWDGYMDGFNYAQVQRLFFNINWSEVNNTQDAELGPLWLGETTVEELIPQLAKKLQEIWTRGIEQLKPQG